MVENEIRGKIGKDCPVSEGKKVESMPQKKMYLYKNIKIINFKKCYVKI